MVQQQHRMVVHCLLRLRRNVCQIEVGCVAGVVAVEHGTQAGHKLRTRYLQTGDATGAAAAAAAVVVQRDTSAARVFAVAVGGHGCLYQNAAVVAAGQSCRKDGVLAADQINARYGSTRSHRQVQTQQRRIDEAREKVADIVVERHCQTLGQLTWLTCHESAPRVDIAGLKSC